MIWNELRHFQLWLRLSDWSSTSWVLAGRKRLLFMAVNVDCLWPVSRRTGLKQRVGPAGWWGSIHILIRLQERRYEGWAAGNRDAQKSVRFSPATLVNLRRTHTPAPRRSHVRPMHYSRHALLLGSIYPHHEIPEIFANEHTNQSSSSRLLFLPAWIKLYIMRVYASNNESNRQSIKYLEAGSFVSGLMKRALHLLRNVLEQCSHPRSILSMHSWLTGQSHPEEMLMDDNYLFTVVRKIGVVLEKHEFTCNLQAEDSIQTDGRKIND